MILMRKIIFGLFCFFSLSAMSQTDIVHGPFKIDGVNSVYIKTENNVNYPLAFYFESGGKAWKVDSYEFGGGVPHVETVFFSNVKGIINVLVLISWHLKHSAEKINGNLYRVYGYKYEHNNLTVNSLINNDPNLDGLDGEFGDKELIFKYKNAATIKKYLKSHYK